MVRLVGGPNAQSVNGRNAQAWEGFLQTYVEAPFVGDWYFVCKEDRMDIKDMHVICRQLGYGYALPPPATHSFTNPTNVPASHRLALLLDCTGMEGRISDCKRDQFPSVSPCNTPQENVAISCSNNLTRARGERKIQIKLLILGGYFCG